MEHSNNQNDGEYQEDLVVDIEIMVMGNICHHRCLGLSSLLRAADSK